MFQNILDGNFSYEGKQSHLKSLDLQQHPWICLMVRLYRHLEIHKQDDYLPQHFPLLN